MNLTPAQEESFARDGYLVVEGVLDKETIIQPVRDEYAALLDALYDAWHREGLVKIAPETLDFDGKLREAYRAGCDWFQPMDISLPGDRIMADTPMHFGPAVFNLLTCPRLLDLVEAFIGPEITSNPIQHVRIKPPAPELKANEVRPHVGPTRWHQDRGVAHPEADTTKIVTVWCAISDATTQNGCLQVIPGAHKGELLPHCPQTQLSIVESALDSSRARPVPVKSGGVLFLDPGLPHSSLDNRSQGFRWSFDIRYSRTGDPTGRAHFPSFVARSRENPDSVLKSWEVWRKMWEDARARLADQPHIPIHRWRADAPHCA